MLEFAPEERRGPDLIQIQVGPGIAVTAESLLDARLAIVCDADLEGSPTHIGCTIGSSARPLAWKSRTFPFDSA
ncbi:MAG TPA: hypothetical protein VMO26_10680 [Vicinamibacterales bacterium]|nr:hypothetical protein [Vicinamibacterales bacterium]